MPEAIDEVVALVNRYTNRCKELIESAGHTWGPMNDPQEMASLQHYLENLKEFAGGAWQFLKHTKRYRSATSPFEDFLLSETSSE